MDNTTRRGGSGERSGVDAEHWFARVMNPACSVVDREAFAQWYASDPAHARSYDDVRRVWEASEEAVNLPVLRHEAEAALHPVRSRYRYRLSFALAASVVVLFVIVGFSWRAFLSLSQAQATRYTTLTGQLRTVELRDGTSLVLDTDSSVSVRYSRHQRTATLSRGRVQFDVKPDADKPFVVRAGDGAVRDVGTVFQVSRDQLGVNVALLRGAVSVTTNGRIPRTTELKPGESLHYSADGKVGTLRKVDLAAATGWTHGNLVVHDWPLTRLIDAMNRYSTVKLTLVDPALGDLRISGVFRAGDDQSLLQMLQVGWSIRSQRVSAREVVLTRADASGSEGHDRQR